MTEKTVHLPIGTVLLRERTDTEKLKLDRPMDMPLSSALIMWGRMMRAATQEEAEIFGDLVLRALLGQGSLLCSGSGSGHRIVPVGRLVP